MPRAAKKPPEAPAQSAPPAQPRSAGTVTVACKFPSGLALQLGKKEVWIEETPGGPRERVRFNRVGRLYDVRGPAYPVGTPPVGFHSSPQIVGGYALTPGIPADFWDEWLAQNAQNSLVVNKTIFAHSRQDHVIGQAREQAGIRTGFEPLTPDNDPRMPKPQTAGVTGIQTADERPISPAA